MYITEFFGAEGDFGMLKLRFHSLWVDIFAGH